MKYFLLEDETLRTSDSLEWFHGNLDIFQVKQCCYNLNSDKVVVKTTQTENIPAGLIEISEEEFLEFKNIF